jgi:putative hydrolase of the HAD superfamily
MPAIKAVIFDLDDTLYPERQYAFSGFAAVASKFQERLGDPENTVTQLQGIFDTEHRSKAFNTLLERLGLPQDSELIEEMIETYRTHFPTISLHPDADAALTRLRPAYKLGLITDGRVLTQGLKLDALGLPPRLDKAIVTGALGAAYEKPHPRAFELMADAFGFSHSQFAFVADNASKDFVAPNALGWTTVQLERPEGIYREVPPAEGGHPMHVLTTLDDLDVLISG